MENHDFKVTDYFAKFLDYPQYFMFLDIYFDSNHSQHENLRQDMQIITSAELRNFYLKNKGTLDFILRYPEIKEIEIKSYYLEDKIPMNLIQKRRESLFNFNYFFKIYNLKLDDENLISTNDLDLELNPIHPKIEFNNNIFTLFLFNANMKLNDILPKVIIYLIQEKSMVFKIRLDPFAINFKPHIYKYFDHGMPLNWDKLYQLRDNEEVIIINDEKGLYCTELYWKYINGNLHFNCEELPEMNNDIKYQQGRYFHAILNQKNKKFTHCDGSVVIYNKEELIERQKFKFKNLNFKLGNHFKIFRVDEDIEIEDFKSLLIAFFSGNYDFFKYINNQI